MFEVSEEASEKIKRFPGRTRGTSDHQSIDDRRRLERSASRDGSG